MQGFWRIKTNYIGKYYMCSDKCTIGKSVKICIIIYVSGLNIACMHDDNFIIQKPSITRIPCQYFHLAI